MSQARSVSHRVLCVVGARPNFMKVAPIRRSLLDGGLSPFVVHTGQHYDAELDSGILSDLGIPEPDVNLGVGSASHAVVCDLELTGPHNAGPVPDSTTNPDIGHQPDDVRSTDGIIHAWANLQAHNRIRTVHRDLW